MTFVGGVFDPNPLKILNPLNYALWIGQANTLMLKPLHIRMRIETCCEKNFFY